MQTFLFTAVNRAGKSVTERAGAENLAQARYRLEIQGYSEITFYESELSGEVSSLFTEKQLKNRNKLLKQQVGFQYDTRLRYYFLSLLKYTFFCWLLLSYFVYRDRDLTSVLWLGGVILMTAYFLLPGIIFNRLHENHCWGRNRRVRFWARAGKWFNKISVAKIPNLEIDIHLACADAREGDLPGALARVARYQDDPQVSERLYKMALIRIYNNARDFDKVLSLLENSLNEGKLHTEELIDYALCLARRHKQTGRARNVLERIFENELTALANLFVPYCQGVIEVEDGNYPQAEFYLKKASAEFEPFRKNTFLVGLKSEINAFLAMSLVRSGRRDEAERLFAEARPYLIAAGEKELLKRCEEALG